MKALADQEKEKKRKYLQPSWNNVDTLLLVLSLVMALSEKKTSPLKRLSALLAETWEKPYSELCGYVSVRMSIAIVRATHMCLRGSRIRTSHYEQSSPTMGRKCRSVFQHYTGPPSYRLKTYFRSIKMTEMTQLTINVLCFMSICSCRLT